MKWEVKLRPDARLREVQVHGTNEDGVLVEVIETRANKPSCRGLARSMKLGRDSTIIKFVCGKELKDPRSIARHIVKCHRALVAEELAQQDSYE